MTDYTRARSMPVSADVLFAYLSDVHHLTEYFPMITSAEPAGGSAVETTAVVDMPDQPERTEHGTAWFDVAEGEQKVTWGSKGDNDYHGEISVAAEGQGSHVTFTLHTEATHPGIDSSIDETLDKIAELSAVGVPQQD